jgi:hypothetical protein
MSSMDFPLAYIDAGSGSLILQAVIAAAVAVPFFLRTQIGRGVRRLRQMTGREAVEVRAADDRAAPR